MVNFWIAVAIQLIVISESNGVDKPFIIRNGNPEDRICPWTAMVFLGMLLKEQLSIPVNHNNVLVSSVDRTQEIEIESGLLWMLTPVERRPIKAFTPNSYYEKVLKVKFDANLVGYFLNTSIPTIQEYCASYARKQEKLAADKKKAQEKIAVDKKKVEDRALARKNELFKEQQEIEKQKRAREEKERIEAERLRKSNTFSPQLISMISNFDVKTSSIRQLIEQGADINYQDSNGYTALMLALDSNNERIAEYLLRLGANPLIKNKYGEIASQLTSESSTIYEKIKGYELIFLTNTKNLRDIRFIVATTHVNINFREALYGYTPLLMAVEAGWIEAVMYFLSVDADIHAKLSDGRGVLELVSDNDVKILLERHIQAQDNDQEDVSEQSSDYKSSFFMTRK